MQLSETQKQIVAHDDGALLVQACAGSGKTRVLTERIRRLLTGKKGNFKILALTYANKAAEEMVSRLKDVKNIKDRTFIGTLHSFALEVIRNKKHEIGLKEVPHIFENSADRKELLVEVIQNNYQLSSSYSSKSEKDQKALIDDSLNLISSKKRNLFFQGNNQFNDLTTEELFFNEYNDLLKSQNAMDYDDILIYAYQILSIPSVGDLYRRIYKYVFIDEAQDLNFAQYQLIKTLCGDSIKNIMMVGDSNQSLYRFNGSDPKFMQEFANDFQAKKIIMNQNFRSSKKVIEFANTLIPKSIDANYTVFIGEAELCSFQNEAEEAKWVFNKIKALLEEKQRREKIGNEELELIEGGISLEKIAVLARNRYVFKELQKLLDENNISYYLKEPNERLVLESDLLNAFDLGLRILSNPLDELHFAQLCNLLKIGKVTNGKAYRSGFEKLSKLEQADTQNVNHLEILLQVWQILDSDNKKVDKVLDLILQYTNGKISEADEKMLILEDIEYYKSIWRIYLQKANTLNKSLADFRRHIALGSIIPSKKEIGLTLSTIHAVKGQEFEIVFLMGMVEGTLPDYRAKTPIQIEEEKNIANVGITRAKKLLYITYPNRKRDYYSQTKSRFLNSFLEHT
jgi:DNA helicase-2/ATP-dependent DNA helicase PcrA